MTSEQGRAGPSTRAQGPPPAPFQHINNNVHNNHGGTAGPNSHHNAITPLKMPGAGVPVAPGTPGTPGTPGPQPVPQTPHTAPPQQQPASEATSSASQLDDGAGRPGAASCVAAPIHGRPPDTAAAAAGAAAVLVSAPARVPRVVAEHEQTSSALTSYHSGSASPSPPATVPPT